jgi:hypothetical protein
MVVSYAVGAGRLAVLAMEMEELLRIMPHQIHLRW